MAPSPVLPMLTSPGTMMTEPGGTAAASTTDTANATKFYTITASLREEYDDNIFTAKDNKVASAVTEFSPSILVNFPEHDNTFSGRYTFGSITMKIAPAIPSIIPMKSFSGRRINSPTASRSISGIRPGTTSSPIC